MQILCDKGVLLAFLLAILSCGGLLFLLKLHAKMMHARASVILRNWAAENQFQLIHSERCAGTGPFNPLIALYGIVFLVRIRDHENKERTGWVICGTFWEHIYFTNHAEVKWQELQ